MNTSKHTSSKHSLTALPHIDLLEKGAPKDGQPQTLARRLYFQLLVFTCPTHVSPDNIVTQLKKALPALNVVASVLYEDVNDPRGFGLLTLTEDPTHFVTEARSLFENAALSELYNVVLKHNFTMLGRTYSSGYEQDLLYWLIQRPAETALNAEWPWAIWYPLRRTGAFAQLDAKDKGRILREHATLGRAYGEQDHAHDIRLACHALDANDNEFIIGLVGKSLHPLSHVVQAMRGTEQTSTYIEKMGPFFVGRVRIQCPGANHKS